MPLSDGPRTPPGYTANGGGLYGTASMDLMESVRELAWPESINTYTKMRRDPQIGATLNAYILPLRAANWAVDPAGCRPEVAAFIADAWGLPILGKDPNEGRKGFRRRGVLWDEHLRVALLQLVYGHMPFAYAGDIGGTPTRWRLTTLAERLPQTISSIEVADDGTLTGIYQYGDERMIPGRNLLWYVHGKEGGNWAGTSMLREAYGPWLLKHDMWRVMGIANRRFGMGVPYVEAPPGATEADVELAARLAQSMRVGDQGGAGLPAGFKPGLMGVTGGVPDTLAFVKYLDSQISQAVLASVLNLPSSDTGNRALGETLIGLLRLSWEAVAKEISIPASRLSARMIDINWGEDEPSPEIVCVGLGRPEPTAEAITALITARAITPDPQMEAWLRERYDLPDIDPEFEKKPPTEYGLPAPGTPEAPASQGGDPANAPDEQKPAVPPGPAPQSLSPAGGAR